MGQYYKIVNLTKKQYLHPHAFDDGMKLLEFGCSAQGTMTALAVLLADGNGRGGGDLSSENPIVGSWAGDRIVIAGDYADKGKYGAGKKQNLYSQCADIEYRDDSGRNKYPSKYPSEDGKSSKYRNISDEVLLAMLDDHYLLQDKVQACLDIDARERERYGEQYDPKNNYLLQNMKSRCPKSYAVVSKAVAVARRQAKANPKTVQGNGGKSLRPDMVIGF